ncbi:MAG TPA: hypothetical protein VF178_00600, partial [Gemmatimonadaceae bacterium]
RNDARPAPDQVVRCRARAIGSAQREALAVRRRELPLVLRRRRVLLLRDRAGTLAPFFRASERPIATACLRLVTRPPCPCLPRRRVPFLRRRIALSTLRLALGPYRRARVDRFDFVFVAMKASRWQ